MILEDRQVRFLLLKIYPNESKILSRVCVCVQAGPKGKGDGKDAAGGKDGVAKPDRTPSTDKSPEERVGTRPTRPSPDDSDNAGPRRRGN